MPEPGQGRSGFQVLDVIDIPVTSIAVIIGQVGKGQYARMLPDASQPLSFTL